MKILIISGFLGAGKTTFIKEMVKQTGRQFAVLENEYGTAGIDGDILKGSLSNPAVSIWEMTEGCICCSTKGDFAASVLTIANTIDTEYLIVEPSGVGKLGNVIQNLQQIEYENIMLMAPLTIVDAQNFEQYDSAYAGIFQDQVAQAKTILLSKTEWKSSQELARLEEELRRIHPEAVILSRHYTTFDPQTWNLLLETTYDGKFVKQKEDAFEKLPQKISVPNARVQSPEALFLFLEDLIHGCYGSVLRAKGVVKAGKYCFRFDVMNGNYSVIGEEETFPAKAVFIGRNISPTILFTFQSKPNIIDN